MRRTAKLLATLATLALVLGPVLAEARPGGGFSSGSRGSRTYSAPPSTNTVPNSGARPMDRTATEPSRPAAPGMAQPGMAAARPGGMFGGGFMAGMMGGLIGVGLGGLLFGNGMFGGLSGFAGILGLLLQVGLVVLLVRFGLKLWRNRSQPAMAGGPGASAYARQPAPQGMAPNAMARNDMSRAGAMGGNGAVATVPVAIGDADFAAFERLLREMNTAWSQRDEAALGRVATPEMAGYFAKDLRDLAGRNWHNETRDVRLEQGDLSEAWREGGTEYATVAMRFSLVDVTRDLATGAVVEGDAERRQTVAELWSFARQGGGAWRVSAIQQTG